MAHPGIAFDPALLAAVAAALTKAGLHERAGDLAAALGRPLDALAAYRKGGAYRKAVELARGAAPAQVSGKGFTAFVFRAPALRLAPLLLFWRVGCSLNAGRLLFWSR